MEIVEKSITAIKAPVSVIMPCYQCVKTIRRAFESIINQTLKPAEIILVDDHSQDGTLDVLRSLASEYPDNVKIIALPSNMGAASARNAGWEIATQPYIAFLDADDEWHPQKIKIQYAYMQKHPEVAISGHAYQVIRAITKPAAVCLSEKARRISNTELLLFNKLVTPSVMVRRELPYRFMEGKRHTEDHLLWLQIANQGGQIALLEAELVYIYKALYGEGGLSGQLWRMEKGELSTYWRLKKQGYMSLFLVFCLSVYSLSKFFRRLILVGIRRVFRANYPDEGRLNYLFPASYLSITHNMTGLLVFLGLLGKSEMAAEVGIVQGATLATFYAFSANARNLILSDSSRVSVADILFSRLLLLIPLGALAILLCVGFGQVEWMIALAIVIRRCIEWINEVHLSERELRGDMDMAAKFITLQILLTGLLFYATWMGDGVFFVSALFLWAVLPGVMSIGFIKTTTLPSFKQYMAIFPVIMPHFGSSTVLGGTLYIFRLLVVLLAGKLIAGDLFTAFAIGSFLGTLYANVLGPSIALHESRSGKRYFPPALLAGMSIAVTIGGILALGGMQEWDVLHHRGKSPYFLLAVGISLVGGVVMIIAQRLRMGLIQRGEGMDVFGPDMLSNILLIAAIPFMYYLFGSRSFALLYFLNAILACIFYFRPQKILARVGDTLGLKQSTLQGLLVFLLFFPIFFQLSGQIYNGVIWKGIYYPMLDTGRDLSALPLPLSILACFLGIFLLGRYKQASVSLATIFWFFALMLFSLMISSGGDITTEKYRLLLQIQFLIPLFGLVFGQIFDVSNYKEHDTIMEKSILGVLCLLVPIQLGVGWIRGHAVLFHYLEYFSIYQHLQYVPLIVACGFFLVMTRLWRGGTYRPVLVMLGLLSAMYVVASYSILSVFAFFAGLLGLALAEYKSVNDKALPVLFLSACLVGGGYFYLTTQVQDEYATGMGFERKRGINANVPLHSGGEGLQQKVVEMVPPNMAERLHDWQSFGTKATSGGHTFLWGKNERESTGRSSAHNYYLDLIYNFGVVSALPIIFLIGYTGWLLYTRRTALWRKPHVAGLIPVVLFLVLIDSNFKVTLRQPYPGLITFFLWGVLLTRLINLKLPRRI